MAPAAPDPLARAGLTVARLIKEHIRASFSIDPNVLRHLDKLVSVLETCPNSLAYYLYDIDPVDWLHDYRAAALYDPACCGICGRHMAGHNLVQAETRRLLGLPPEEAKREDADRAAE